MDPNRRLLFWLRVPYAVDVVLVVIGIALLLSAREVGWWVIVFAAVRAVIGSVALVWIAPRVMANREARQDDDSRGSGDGGVPSGT